jgi:hypothetical protein
MMHLQFGGHGHYLGYGMEASYWSFLDGIWPWGFYVGGLGPDMRWRFANGRAEYGLGVLVKLPAV